MPEQAQLTLARVHRALRVVGVEDVVVLVERRAVADFDAVVDHHRPGRQCAQVLAVVVGQRLAGPHRGVFRDLVEVAGVVDAAGRLVVVAADDGDRAQPANAIDDAVGLAAVADEIAEHQQAIPAALDRGKDGLERVEVRVDVGEDKIGRHVSDRYSARRSISMMPSMMRSTTASA